MRVGLLIDASNSIRDRFRFEQDAAVEFLHQVVRPKSDQAFVIGFDSVSDLTQDYTDNTDALAHGVRVLRPGGGTALHDAVFQASEKLAKAPVRGPSRRAIILLSDGDDNQSRHTREEAIEAALRAEVIIYVISTNITGEEQERRQNPDALCRSHRRPGVFSAAHRRGFQCLCRNSGRVAQPVRGRLQAAEFRAGRTLPRDLN